MTKRHGRRLIAAETLAAVLMLAGPVHAELSSEELAKIAQNPVGNLISVPFQENLNLNTGPLQKNYNLLNIQPVIPIDVDEDWNIITRTCTWRRAAPGCTGRLPQCLAR